MTSIPSICIGTSFELTKIGGKATSGIFKDVVMVGGYQEAEVDFVADNPGLTLFHCHQQLAYGFRVHDAVRLCVNRGTVRLGCRGDLFFHGRLLLRGAWDQGSVVSFDEQ